MIGSMYAIVPPSLPLYHTPDVLISAHFPLGPGPDTMQTELFDAQMLAPLVQYLDRNGARAEAFLDRAHIPGELITGGGWVTKKQAYNFTYDIVKRSRFPGAIFTAYLDFQFDHLGPVAQAMKACKTVKEALEVGTKLGSAAYEGNEYFLKTEDATTWFCFREPKVIAEGQTFINDMTLTVYYHLIRAVTEEDWRPEKMCFRRELVERHQTVERFEDCHATIHPAYSAIAFPTEFLSRRSPWQNHSSTQKKTWSVNTEESEPVIERISRLLSSQFPYRKFPLLEETANIFDVSPATLKRELKSVGTTYRQLLDRLRFDIACDMLSDPQLTIRDIALELGYSGANNFVRSFHRMTGLSPGRYRRHQRRADSE